MEVIFYSTHCPKCIVLEKKLKQKNVPYVEVNDVGVMQEKGFLQMPMLEVDSNTMDFVKANQWLNNQ